jgi:hypothetical protein
MTRTLLPLNRNWDDTDTAATILVVIVILTFVWKVIGE